MKNLASERSEREKKILIIIALSLSVCFVILRCIIYITPYEFFSAADTYRDYTSIQTYILGSEDFPIDVAYRDRPFFYYFVVNMHLLTGISLFDLLRIIVPISFTVVTLFFYLFYKELFQKEFISIAGALITVTNNKFFSELVEVRPSTMALVLFPIIGYFFIKWQKNRNNPWLFVILIITLLSLHFSHFFGTLLFCFIITLLIAQQLPKIISKIKKHWMIFIPTMLISILLIIVLWEYISNLLPIRTFFHAVRVFTSSDPNLISNEAMSISEILTQVNVWYGIVAFTGLTILIIDYIKRKKDSLINHWIIFFGLMITVFFIFIVTIGTRYGLNILPYQMMTDIWPGLVLFFLYFLHRLNHRWIVIPYLLMSLFTMGMQRTPHDAVDHAYILGNEIELIPFIENKDIKNAVMLTQSTNVGIFTFDKNHNKIVTNYEEPNTTLFAKIFFAQSSAEASNSINKTLKKNNIGGSRDIYIVFSTVKNYNQYLWPNEWFRKPSLEGANLALFDNGDYFTPVFDNQDIKMWKWTHKID